MLEKIPPLPPGISELLAPAWVWLLGVIGAFVGMLEDFKADDGWRIWIFKAITRVASSALAAVLTYHFLLSMKVGDENMQVVLIGVAGHMGVEALRVLGDFYRSKVGK